MSTPYEDLVQFIESNGVTEAEGEHALRRCLIAMGKAGLVGYASGGAISYFMTMNPATVFPFLTATTAAGAGYALVNSPSCSEVREAVAYWRAANLGF